MEKETSNNEQRHTIVLSDSIITTSTDDSPWYAIRLFTPRQQAIGEYFENCNLETFIPMQYVDFEDRQGQRKRELRPVVRNLIFVKKTISHAQMTALMQQSPFKMSVRKESRDSCEYYEIPSRQMREFRLMCNPEIEMRQYLSENEAKLKTGTQVNVVFGPLKGLTGKLVRQSHKYYLLKEIPGIAVMLKVSRWCCKAAMSR